MKNDRNAKGMRNFHWKKFLTWTLLAASYHGRTETKAEADSAPEVESRTATESVARATTEIDLDRASTLLTRIEELLAKRNVEIKSRKWAWSEFESFQEQLMQTMALDPAKLDSQFIPPHLEPTYMTQDLEEKLERLVGFRSIAVKFGAAAEFDEYVKQVHEIFELRYKRLYRVARLIAKKGILAEKFQAVTRTIAKNADASFEMALSWNDDDREEVLSSLQEMASTLRVEMGQDDGSGIRGPASVGATELTPKRVQWIRRLFPGLLFLVFLTGLIAGSLWKRREA
jgi:hypothetical protein